MSTFICCDNSGCEHRLPQGHPALTFWLRSGDTYTRTARDYCSPACAAAAMARAQTQTRTERLREILEPEPES